MRVGDWRVKKASADEDGQLIKTDTILRSRRCPSSSSLTVFMQSFNKIGQVVLLQMRFTFLAAILKKKFNFRPSFWIEVINVEC